MHKPTEKPLKNFQVLLDYNLFETNISCGFGDMKVTMPAASCAVDHNLNGSQYISIPKYSHYIVPPRRLYKRLPYKEYNDVKAGTGSQYMQLPVGAFFLPYF